MTFSIKEKNKTKQVLHGDLAVKDLVFLLLWLRFDLWSGNFCMLLAQPKKQKKKRKKQRRSHLMQEQVCDTSEAQNNGI